jgi:hypothetical protein
MEWSITGVDRGKGTVEDQLGAARALVVDAPGNADLLALGRLARLEVAKLLKELGVVVRDLELVRVRVGLGVLEHCLLTLISTMLLRKIPQSWGQRTAATYAR